MVTIGLDENHGGEDVAGKQKRQSKHEAPRTTAEPPPVKRMTTEEAFEKLRRRANRGDREAQQALKRFLDSNDFLWAHFGDLARVAETTFIQFATDGEWLASAAVAHQSAKMRRDLAGANPSPLEKMAVERVVACWQQLQYVRASCARSQRHATWARFWARREEQTHRMYDAAVKSLILVRGLQLKDESSGADHFHPAPAQRDVDTGVRKRVSKSNGHTLDGGEPDLTCATKKKPACTATQFNGHNRIAAFLEPLGVAGGG